MQKVSIGVIGCGNISRAYLTAAQGFPVLDIKAVADLDMSAAEAKADEFGLKAMTVDALLADPSIELVLNLTIPAAHVSVGLATLRAGKHAYSEKPLGIDFSEARTLIAEGERLGLRVGCAPDTFLGGGHQTARDVIDSGVLGEPVGGTAFFMCPGHERWHPNPDFYYKPGGGPLLDMGPYYITDLVNLLGPVARVSGMAPKPRPQRTITSEPRKGEIIDVEVPTHIVGLLEFQSGAVATITTSFDVAGHKHLPIEIYGTEASLLVPDPNKFGGEVMLLKKGGEWTEVPVERPFADGNYRSLGLADMAAAIREDRPHRASGALALHVLEVMDAVGRAIANGKIVDITTRPERPEPLAASRPLERAA